MSEQTHSTIMEIAKQHLNNVPEETIRAMADSIGSTLFRLFHSESRCPVCSQKRRNISESGKARLKSISLLPRKKRAAPATKSVLCVLKQMPASFSSGDLLKECCGAGEKTVRNVITSLHKCGELTSPAVGTWSKTVKFGNNPIWDCIGPQSLF